MSTLLDRARKIYGIAKSHPEPDALEIITALLRCTRQEGIKVGIEQYDRHGLHLTERKSA